MPVDAVAFGATVPATHLYEIPVGRDQDPHGASGNDSTTSSRTADQLMRDARPG